MPQSNVGVGTLGIAFVASVAMIVGNTVVGRGGYSASTVEAVTSAGVGVNAAMWLVIGIEVVRAAWGRRPLRPWLLTALRVAILLVTALNVGLILGGHRSAVVSFASSIAMLILVAMLFWPLVTVNSTGER